MPQSVADPKNISYSIQEINGHDGILMFDRTVSQETPVGHLYFCFEGTNISETIDPKDREFYIESIIIEENLRKRNYGTMLLAEAIRIARIKNATIITLAMDHGCGFGERTFGPLERFYFRAGFAYSYTEAEIGDRDDIYNPGAMEKRLLSR